MKTLRGVETYGYFALGSDGQFAAALFSSLLGEEEVFSDSVITIDLVKRENNLLFPFGLLHCSYEQLAENIKIITKELFKRMILEDNA